VVLALDTRLGASVLHSIRKRIQQLNQYRGERRERRGIAISPSLSAPSAHSCDTLDLVMQGGSLRRISLGDWNMWYNMVKRRFDGRTIVTGNEVISMLGFDRITFDPNVMGGRACIRGMRVTVSLIVNLVANGMGIEEIIEAYPYLEPDDIRQALQYVAWLAEETIHALEPAAA
jgi:uncharacterized protein (DUF433 family)